jgi:hypothetical protein
MLTGGLCGAVAAWAGSRPRMPARVMMAVTVRVLIGWCLSMNNRTAKEETVRGRRLLTPAEAED